MRQGYGKVTWYDQVKFLYSDVNKRINMGNLDFFSYLTREEKWKRDREWERVGSE